MPERGAFSRSWTLLLQSFRILRRHPRLLMFPMLGLLSFAAGVLPFALLIRATRLIAPGSPGAGTVMLMMPFGLLSPFIFFLMVSLMSGAFYHEGTRALAGEAVSIRRGFLAALKRIRVLIFWQLFAAMAMSLTRLIGGQFGIGGRIAEFLVGLGWGAASFFVLPIIMREPPQPAEPVRLVRQSVALLRNTWGESVTSYAGLTLLGLPVLAVAVAAAIIARTGGSLLQGPWIALIAVSMAWALVLGVAGAMFRCVLYVYASEGVLPGDFTEEQLNAAWKIKVRA